MSASFPRVARKIAAICLPLVTILVVALVLVSGASAGTAATAPRRTFVTTRTPLEDARGKYPSSPLLLRDEVLAFPPATSRARADGSARPATVVYLHGVHGRAENGCPWLREGASELGWLVCPRANARHEDGTYSWGGTLDEKRATITRAESAAVAAGADPNAPSVIVGFSQGSWVALDLANAEPGRYRGLVLLAGDVTPDAAALRRSGVERVVLGAGALDATFKPLERTTARLRSEGIDARFVSLGHVGHTYVAEDTGVLRDAITWAGGG